MVDGEAALCTVIPPPAAEERWMQEVCVWGGGSLQNFLQLGKKSQGGSEPAPNAMQRKRKSRPP